MRLIDADSLRDDWLKNEENEFVYYKNAVLDSIDDAPTIDAVPMVHGRWIPNIPQKQERITRSPLAINWYCSECKTEGSPHWKRCPVCEAKMELEIDHG